MLPGFVPEAMIGRGYVTWFCSEAMIGPVHGTWFCSRGSI